MDFVLFGYDAEIVENIYVMFNKPWLQDVFKKKYSARLETSSCFEQQYNLWVDTLRPLTNQSDEKIALLAQGLQERQIQRIRINVEDTIEIRQACAVYVNRPFRETQQVVGISLDLNQCELWKKHHADVRFDQALVQQGFVLFSNSDSKVCTEKGFFEDLDSAVQALAKNCTQFERGKGNV